MNHERLIKAFEKKGFKVEQCKFKKTRFFCKGVAHICEWWKQDDAAVCVRIRRYTDHDDSQSDYSAGFFVKTIKSAVEYINGGVK